MMIDERGAVCRVVGGLASKRLGGVVDDGGGEAGGGVVEEAEGPADEGEEGGGVDADLAVEGAVDDDPTGDAGAVGEVGPGDVASEAGHEGGIWGVSGGR